MGEHAVQKERVSPRKIRHETHLVGAPELESGTSAVSGRRSNQLSYAPGTPLNERGRENRNPRPHTLNIGYYSTSRVSVKGEGAVYLFFCEVAISERGLKTVCIDLPSTSCFKSNNKDTSEMMIFRVYRIAAGTTVGKPAFSCEENIRGSRCRSIKPFTKAKIITTRMNLRKMNHPVVLFEALMDMI